MCMYLSIYLSGKQASGFSPGTVLYGPRRGGGGDGGGCVGHLLQHKKTRVSQGCTRIGGKKTDRRKNYHFKIEKQNILMWVPRAISGNPENMYLKYEIPR